MAFSNVDPSSARACRSEFSRLSTQQRKYNLQPQITDTKTDLTTYRPSSTDTDVFPAIECRTQSFKG